MNHWQLNQLAPPLERQMKHLLLTTIAAVVLVGCGESQQSAPLAEAKPEPPTAEAPDISIHMAALRGNIEDVKQHLAAGADVDAKDSDGWTPLHWAAEGGHKDVAELLIAAGTDVNAKVPDGWTPLHSVALGGHKEIAEILIAEGADVDAKHNGGGTPLDEAIRYKKTETADLLRKHGGKTKKELEAAGN